MESRTRVLMFCSFLQASLPRHICWRIFVAQFIGSAVCSFIHSEKMFLFRSKITPDRSFMLVHGLIIFSLAQALVRKFDSNCILLQFLHKLLR